MTKLITIDDIRQIIDRIGILDFFALLIQELKLDFSRWQEFQKNPRIAAHLSNGVIELMPIYDHNYYAFKYVNGHPNNPLNHKLTVVATGMLADISSGYPLLISEMTLLTAFRTAATTALAASYLAPKNSTTLGLIGTGAQSEFLALAHYVALGIKKIKYFDLDSAAMQKFAENLKNYDLTLEACQDAFSAVDNVDVIVTATAAKKRAHIIENNWIHRGVHIGGIGGDCPGKTELDPALLQRAKIVIEYYPQSSVEGEIQNLPMTPIYAELWEIVSGNKTGRENPEEITLFDSVGFALEDYSILKLIYHLAQQLNIGKDINIIPELESPKDLFSLLNYH